MWTLLFGGVGDAETTLQEGKALAGLVADCGLLWLIAVAYVFFGTTEVYILPAVVSSQQQQKIFRLGPSLHEQSCSAAAPTRLSTRPRLGRHWLGSALLDGGPDPSGGLGRVEVSLWLSVFHDQ